MFENVILEPACYTALEVHMGAMRCRPLTDLEVNQVTEAFQRTRDRALFVLGIYTGFRIAELCSLKVSDVQQYGRVRSSVTVQKRFMKGSKAGRTVLLNPIVMKAIGDLIGELKLGHDDFLFKSKKAGAITETQARRIFRTVFDSLGLEGNLSTHSMRKTFAKKVYEASGRDLRLTQLALGHSSIDSTSKYLEIGDELKNNVVLSIKF